MQPTTDKIFVSYSRHDEVFARKLAVWLANTLSLGIWIDIDDIQPGVKWSDAIQDGLDNCEVMVVIVTPESMQSINVEDEWQYFIDLGKPIVPILLRSAPVPYQLRRIQWIDFSDKDEYNNSLRQLIVELRQHLKPLEGETSIPQGRAHKEPVVRSKKEKKTRRRMHNAEDLIEKQGRALKRSNRLISVLVFLMLVLVVGVGAVFGWLYINRPAIFTITGDTIGGFAILPGSNEIVTLASLDGSAPEGTQIRAGEVSIQLFSEGGRIETVLQPDSIATVDSLTDEGIELQLENGNASTETNGAQAVINLTNGVGIETNNNLEVSIDAENDIVTSNCFEGDCTVTDSNSGNTVNLREGQSLTFSNSSPVLDENNIRDITGAIAYVTNQHGAAEIYLMDYQGERRTRLTNNTRVEDEAPTWSPTGEFLAYVSDLGGSLDIWMMSPTGETEPVNLTDSFSQDTAPAWSPDGQFIAFVSNRENGIDDIYILTIETSEVQRITTTGRSDSPAWSPDGTQLVFSSSRSGDNEIFLLDLTDPASEAINISNHEASDTDPSWSHDGERIAFVSDRDGNLEIYVMTVADIGNEDSEAINVSRHTGRDFEPTWSPESDRVLFTSERFGDLDIIAVSADLDANASEAANVQRLTDSTSESDQEAAWLPIIRAGQ